MKYLLFCCLFIGLFSTGQGQPARVKLDVKSDCIVNHEEKRYELKAGDTWDVVLEGMPCYGEVFRVNFHDYYFFLCPGECLEIVLKENKRVEVKDDGSLCAERNLFLHEMAGFQQEFYYAKAVPELVSESVRDLTLDGVCDTLHARLERYLGMHPGEAKDFGKVVRTELKYYRMYEACGAYGGRRTFYEFPGEVLQQLAEVIPDSKDKRVICSPTYWKVLKVYTDYLRVEDPRRLLGPGRQMYENEVRLAKYYAAKEIRERLVYENFLDVLYWVKPYERESVEKCIRRLPSRYAEFIRKNLDKQDVSRAKRKWVMPGCVVELSGEDVNGEEVRLSSFRGSWIFLDVWATWCGPCNSEIPYLKKMEEKLRGKNIVFVSLSVDKTADREKWKNLLREKKMEGVQLRWNGRAKGVHEMLGITGIPHFAIVDPEGVLRWNNLPFVSSGLIYRILREVGDK